MTHHRSWLRTVLCLCAAVATANVAWADEDPPLAGKKPAQQSQDGEKQDRADDDNDRPRRPQRADGEGRGGRRDPGMFIERMSEELSLTAEQKDKVRDIMSKRFEQARQGEGAGLDMDKVRDLREQARDARDAGDDEKARELGEQMRELMTANRDAMEKSRAEMNKQIEAVLNPEQREKFAKMQEQMAERGGFGRRGGPGSDPQALKRAVMGLKLGEEQRAKLEALFKNAMKESNDLPRGDRQARMDMMRDLRDDVMNELTKDQKAELQEKLAEGRFGRGEGRGRRGGDDDEGRRPRRPANPDKGNAAPDRGDDL